MSTEVEGPASASSSRFSSSNLRPVVESPRASSSTLRCFTVGISDPDLKMNTYTNTRIGKMRRNVGEGQRRDTTKRLPAQNRTANCGCSEPRTASFHRRLLFCRHISNMDKLGPTWPAEEIFLFFQGVTSPLKPQHTVAAVFLRTRRPRSASKISARANSHAVFALRLRDWCTLCLADSLHILLNDRIPRMWQELE